MAGTILVIDDENNMRWVLQKAFQRAGYEVFTASRGSEGLQLFARHAVDLVLLDLKMPGMDGLSLLRELRSRNSETPILLFTAYATVATAVEALKVGANDYIRKPFDIEAVLTKIAHYLHGTSPTLPKQEPEISNFAAFIGTSSLLDAPLAQAATAAAGDYTVLIRGESGTGRRHLANIIHQQRHQGRLVTINCAGLPAPLIERELLEQAITDSSCLYDESSSKEKCDSQKQPEETSRKRWQQALGGTLLLANCDMLPVSLVDSLVRQISNYFRTPHRPHGLRLFLTATESLDDAWKPICQMSIEIKLPPLRQRIDDLYLLLAHFAPDTNWESAALAQLRSYSWPGNIGELQRVAQQVSPIAANNLVRPEQLPPQISSESVMQNWVTAASIVLPPEGIELEAVEKDLIRQALERTNGNKAGAARLLGLTRATLLYRLSKYSIDSEGFEE